VAENGVTLQCKECGWERDYPIKKVFVKAPKLGFEPNKDELTPEQKEFLRPMGAEFTILERKKK
jgi:RNase P subunit RPR2